MKPEVKINVSKDYYYNDFYEQMLCLFDIDYFISVNIFIKVFIFLVLIFLCELYLYGEALIDIY